MALYMNGQEISQSSGVPIEITGIDTNDATAIASDIKAGKIAYVKDEKIIGTSTFDADTSDATATAENIENGKTAYVNGIKITGNFTYSKYYTGALSPESSVGNEGDLFFVVQE